MFGRLDEERGMMTRRTLLGVLAGGVSLAFARTIGARAATPMVVYKNPSCGCCTKWVTHMEANGFTATVHNVDLLPIRAKYKIGPKIESCHTAVIGNYVIEGHVPASDVKTFLAAKPRGILGLTIPGMPQSAPGMDVMPFQPFTVLTFDDKGVTAMFKAHAKAPAGE